MININQCIEFLAANGASKRSVAQALGIPLTSFYEMCNAMPDVEWKPRGKTNGDRRGLHTRKVQAARRMDRLQKETITLDSVVTLFGHTGTIREIADKFSPVHRRSALHRLRLGFDLEEAILKSTNRGPARHETK